MALTLSRVMQRTWRELGLMVTVKASGGGTTTVVDSSKKYTTADALVGGTVIVIRDVGGVAPEGEFSLITNYEETTWTFTMDALTTAVAAGDIVGLARATITAEEMVQCINDGIRDLGHIQTYDSSLSLVSGQIEYALPVALKRDDLVGVFVDTTDDDENWKSILSYCTLHPAAPGSTGLLVINEAVGYAGHTLKIVYNGEHPLLTVYSSTVSEYIHEKLAVAASVEKALTWLISKRGDSALNTFIVQRYNDARQNLENTKREYPIFRPTKQATKWFVSSVDTDVSDIE